MRTAKAPSAMANQPRETIDLLSRPVRARLRAGAWAWAGTSCAEVLATGVDVTPATTGVTTRAVGTLELELPAGAEGAGITPPGVIVNGVVKTAVTAVGAAGVGMGTRAVVIGDAFTGGIA